MTDDLRLVWVVELLRRGTLVDMTRPMSLGSAKQYFRSWSSMYQSIDGYRLRLVGYSNTY